MKKALLFVFAIFAASLLYAQAPRHGGGNGQPQGPSITGRITGTLLDSLSGQAVEFASVVLISQKSGKEVDGTVTDEKGQFKFPEAKIDSYKIYFSFLGYDEKFLQDIELTPEKPDARLNDIHLVPTSLVLDAVTVVGKAAVVENKIDRIVYNADKDVSLGSGDAADVLRRVPLLSVDLDGNVSLRGSSNIQILINGKPSGMFSSNVADALKMFPAEQIKSVEVITSPSAKYDGEGTAGIINIITHKKQVDGYTGSINVAPGNRSNTTSLNINAAKGRFGVNGGAFAVYSNPRDGVFRFERGPLEGSQKLPPSLTQNGITNTSRIGYRGNFGAFYDINAYNAFNSSISFHGRNFDRDGTTDAFLSQSGIEEITNRDNLNKTVDLGYDWNTDYTRTFPNSEREFSLGVQVSGNVSNADTRLLQTGNFENLGINEISKDNGTNLETTFQADYVHPFSKNVKLETGAKTILRTINSDFFYDTLSFGNAVYLRDASRSDEFDYQQDVYAGYASMSVNFAERYGLIAGVRYEYTGITGDYKFDETYFANDYANWLPSVIVSRKMSEFSSLKVSYNQRIQRPNLRFINPYVDQQDRNNISFGNPEVDPEITHNFELGYSTFLKGMVLNASLYYRRTTDVIERIVKVDETEGFSYNTYENAGLENATGLSLFGSVTVKKIWQIRGNADIRRVSKKSNLSDLNQSNTGYELDSHISSTFNLPKGFRVELFGLFRNPRVSLQGTRATFWMYSLGLQKDIFNKRGSVGLRLVNLFHRALDFDSFLVGEDFYQNSYFEYPFRSYGLSFKYRFGKLDFKTKERKSKVKNNDQKSGGDQNY
jgi:outer membrane receptor protein involved in Fe transport